MKLKELLFSSLCFLELSKFSTVLSCHFCDDKQSYTIHHFLKVKLERKHFGNHFLTKVWCNMVIMKNCYDIAHACGEFSITVKKNQPLDFILS